MRTHTHTHTHTHTNTSQKHSWQKPRDKDIRGTVIILEYFFCTLPKPECQYLAYYYLLLLLNKPDFRGRQTESKVTSALLWVSTMVPTLVPWLRTSVLRFKSGCSGGSGQVLLIWNEPTENPFVGIGTRKNHWDCEKSSLLLDLKLKLEL